MGRRAVTTPGWAEDWASKVTTADAAARRIKSGDHVFVGSGAATPQLLVQAMCSPSLDVADVEVTSIMTMGSAPFIEPAAEGRGRHHSMFIGSHLRRAGRGGAGGDTP